MRLRHRGTQMKLNDYTVPPFLTISSISRPSAEVEFESSETASNLEILGNRNKETTITVKGMIRTGETVDKTWNTLTDIRDELMLHLYTDDDIAMTFSDEPDRIWYARFNGNYNPERINKRAAHVEWSFIVSKGKSKSTVNKTFQATKNSSGIWEFTIDNQGTAPVPIDYRIKLKKESGYIGLVSQYGAMQFGKVDELDSEIYKQNEILLNSPSFDAWQADTVNIQNSGNAINGSLKVTGNGDQPILVLDKVGSGTGWHGGVRTAEFKADSEGKKGSKNWYCYSEIAFEAWIHDQSGAITLCFYDKNKKSVFEFVIWKTTRDNYKTVVTWAGRSKVMQEITFDANNEGFNPFTADKGYFSIRKLGSEVQVHLFGKIYKDKDTSIENTEVVGCQVFIGQWGNRTVIDRNYISKLFFMKFIFEKTAVEKWRDVPNRFQPNREYYMNGSETKFYINNIPSLDDEIRGTQWFKAPPGETKVQLYVSDFSEIESATAEIREAFL
ncbi:distal tail protein Dit [Enterococcus sp. AZ109]|uniref:distal tail protein Dit n=1 Tax=Enterococcus sp. AZ109 TaxID=2774634 RepID=UPI003F25C748